MADDRKLLTPRMASILLPPALWKAHGGAPSGGSGQGRPWSWHLPVLCRSPLRLKPRELAVMG
jgi:hypothetical protein